MTALYRRVPRHVTRPQLGLFAFWAFFSQMYQAPQQARLVDRIPSQREILLALNASTMYIGVSVGSFISGALLGPAGVRGLPAIGLIAPALAGLTHLISLRTAPAPAALPATAAPRSTTTVAS